ncbi:NDP-hexose 2,3-dehydratase family protein [Saccharothrix longispora]|uniref:Oxidase EvaA n=1 Tax=Saccharothrix longispora TaxID=33920 RepID=A0ABU1PR64_9PSEU|nr:NDP-hexose 2,3-dehydratase family protein [Saccharothrix longispora]MDR6593142.1 oxidase EvaA [Saccharothrix longispora]
MQPVAELGQLRRADPSRSSRVERSLRARDGGVLDDAGFRAWLADRRRAQRQEVRRVPLAAMDRWGFAHETGNLGHVSGRFFTIEGIHVTTDSGAVREWAQPIINQPEIGILGIAVREIDGVLHCLVQAKYEPGNVNGVQLSPTVQATRSNYMRVHGGAEVPYLSLFREAEPSRVLADVLQSEQGAWFYRKRNRNMVVEVGDDVEAREDFCWLTLGQLLALLDEDDLVGMDTRTVLSCIPYGGAEAEGPTPFAEALRRSRSAEEGGLHTTTEVLSWITGMHARHELHARRIPLCTVGDWKRTDYEIAHVEGRYFKVVAVDVLANSREVSSWRQPLLEPVGTGVAALLVREFHGVLHVLVNAHVEPGYLDTVELAPTVQATPENYAHLPAEHQPRFLDLVLAPDPAKVRFDTVLSEEGGRFLHARTRYLVVEDDSVPAQAPPGFHWLTVHQLADLLQHSHYVNVQARTLFACLLAA